MQPGAYQQPYAPQGYGYGYQPPRKAAGGRTTVIVAIAAVIIVVGFTITMWSLLFGGSTDETTTGPTTTTTTPTAPPPPPVEVPAPDMNPSDLPVPDSYDEAWQWVTGDPVYSGTITVPTDCTVQPVDVQTASVSALEAHLNELTACLWRVWNPPLVAAGYELPRPPATVYTQPITTACGDVDDLANAAYCAADQRIYFGKNVYQVVPANLRKAPFIVDTVIAHEFGHTVQARTGILISQAAWQQRSTTTKDQALEISRRKEMQADCLAGMFTSSVAAANHLSPADLKNLGLVIHATGDDVLNGQPGYVDDHGSGAARQSWFTAGQGSDQIATCNTFIADSGKVH